MRTYRPGPRGQAPAVTWRQWLLPLGAAVGIVALVALSPRAPSGVPLSYSQFLNDVGAGSVRSVIIDPAGQVTGSLATGQPFTTTIPVALDDRTLAGRLAAHHVQVTATAAMPSSPVPVLIGLLLLVMIGGLFYVGVRGDRRETAGLRGLTGMGDADEGERADNRRRTVGYPVRRRGRLRRGEDRDRRGRRLPARSRPVPGGRGARSARRADGRAARHRQDPARPGGGGRGARPVPVDIGCELRRNVRRCGRCPSAGLVRPGPHPGAGHRIHRRDRCSRHPARRPWPGRQRRAGADPQPASRRDGRIRAVQWRGGPGRHEPARCPRPGPAPARPVRPRGHRPAAQPGQSGEPS